MTVGMGETVEVLVGTSKLEVLKAQTGSTMLAIFPVDDFCMCMYGECFLEYEVSGIIVL